MDATRAAAPPATVTLAPAAIAPAVPRPRIDVPASGAVYSPGPLTIAGSAAPGSTVRLAIAGPSAALLMAIAGADGRWSAAATLDRAGDYRLAAAVSAGDGVLESDPVTITIAPALQPDTGGALETTDPDATSRMLTALLALLLAAGGFSLFFAGRVIMLRARDRLRH